MGEYAIYIKENGKQRFIRPEDMIDMQMFTPFINMVNRLSKNYSRSKFDDPLSLGDVIKSFSTSHIWESFDSTFDDTYCSFFCLDPFCLCKINSSDSVKSFSVFHTGKFKCTYNSNHHRSDRAYLCEINKTVLDRCFYCFGVLRSRYHQVLDLYAVKVNKINNFLNYHVDICFFTYNDFQSILKFANVKLPVAATRLFRPGRRELTSNKYKFCGVLTDRYHVNPSGVDFNRKVTYFFVLAYGDAFFQVTLHELRLLVAFNAVEGLCLKSGRVSLTERARSEFRTKYLVDFDRRQNCLVLRVPLYGYYSIYDKRIAVINGFYPSCVVEPDFILEMAEAGFNVLSVAGYLMSGQDRNVFH